MERYQLPGCSTSSLPSQTIHVLRCPSGNTVAHTQKRLVYIPPAPFRPKANLLILRLKEQTPNQLSPVPRERRLPRCPISSSAGVMGQRKKKTHGCIGKTSPLKHRGRKQSFFFFKPKMCKRVVLLKGRSIILRSSETTYVPRRISSSEDSQGHDHGVARWLTSG